MANRRYVMKEKKLFLNVKIGDRVVSCRVVSDKGTLSLHPCVEMDGIFKQKNGMRYIRNSDVPCGAEVRSLQRLVWAYSDQLNALAFKLRINGAEGIPKLGYAFYVLQLVEVEELSPRFFGLVRRYFMWISPQIRVVMTGKDIRKDLRPLLDDAANVWFSEAV